MLAPSLARAAGEGPGYYMVQMTYKDAENPRNNAYHKIRLELTGLKGVEQCAFIADDFAFYVRANDRLDETTLKNLLGSRATIFTMTARTWEQKNKEAFAAKLADAEGKYRVQAEGFPVYTDNGNTEADRAAYKDAALEWLETNSADLESLKVIPANK